MNDEDNFFSRLIKVFLTGNFAILLVIISLVSGLAALLITPREEEPQIVVPVADVLISAPGLSVEEVEKQVASRLEKMLFQIDGVEYVYSMSRPGMAIVTVRFYVGEDREKSLIKLYNKVFQNVDKTTPGIAGWVIKPIEIDDVPIINIALYSERYSEHELYRVAEELSGKLQNIKNTARISIHGGQKRIINLQLDTERLNAYHISPMEIAGALKISNAQMESGSFDKANKSVTVEAGPFLSNVDELKNLVIAVSQNRPVYLKDVATITDGPEDISSYSRISFGMAEQARELCGKTMPAVTLAIAKKKGSNAVTVSHQVEEALEKHAGTIIPTDVKHRITRNYGETADEKVNGLIEGLVLAIITVIGLITLTMNWRTGFIVVMAVPITYSLTLLVNMLLGYTINRVTLFALILALGLLVDDPIVGVENIHRHLSMRKKSRLDAILGAMNEVLPPLVVATLAVIIAFIPMFFITGMMGPYMKPMAVNVPLSMLVSLIVSLTITPWLANLILHDKEGAHQADSVPTRETKTYKAYRRIVEPFIDSPRKAKRLMMVIALLTVGSVLMALGIVPLKTLPFDNKNEFQFVVDMPESATLEQTAQVVHELEKYIGAQPEVVDYTSTIGSSSPIDFNGMVRHYYLRQGNNVADIRVNLLDRKKRALDCHAITLRMRNDISAMAKRTGSVIKIVETPPGPPVLSSIVAEVYGQAHSSYEDLIKGAAIVKSQMAETKGVVDIDDTVEEAREKFFFRVDREKAGLNGISTEDIVQTLSMALGGMQAGILHVQSDQNELPIILQLPREKRSDTALLSTISMKGRMGNMVQLGELGKFESTETEKSIYHKNLERVVFVTAESAGVGPAYPVLALQSHFKKNPLPNGITADWSGEGEWKITIDVFRDLGIAFAAALIGIYILLTYQTGSFVLPVVIMMSIPLTLIGIMPGFWILNLLVNRQVGGFDNPVFFTATAMIGTIALAGIVVRNGIILVDFINHSIKSGMSIKEAILESGAVRFRPIFLTAGAAMLGSWPITLDPIFSGLAWSLIFGLLISTFFTLLVIPVVYYMIYGKGDRNESK